jgi:putative sporulation protein YtxC
MRYLEIAIDEYKLQQEYAAFVDKLRRIVKAYRPLRNVVYAIDCQPMRLYDEHFKPIENTNAIRSFYPLLKQWGVDAEPSILLTLIGLSPLKVFVYTDRQDDGMMRTLLNVFEERVEFRPLAEAKKIDL